jgi:P4 family phage/plasmid primase-like protien
MSSIKYYDTKTDALKRLSSSKSKKILCNRNITKYFLANDYKHFLDIIKRSPKKDFYEFVSSDLPVCFYYDIEIYKPEKNYKDQETEINDTDENKEINDTDENKENSDKITIENDEEITVENVEVVEDNYFENYNKILDKCIEKTRNIVLKQFPEVRTKCIILESHSVIKRSFHIILRFFRDDDKEIVFENVSVLKNLYKRFGLDHLRDSNNKYIVDPSVYREGLFRTLYSSKPNESRPMVKSEMSDDFEEIETFVGYMSSDYIIYDTSHLQDEIIDVVVERSQKLVVNVPEDLNDDDKITLRKFVQKEFHHFPNRIRDVFIDKTHNCIIIALMERYCPFLDREHRGNNQYIVIDTSSAKQKCHNQECNEDKYNEMKLENYPKEVNEIIKKCLKVNQQELDLIDHAIIECKNYIHENFDKDVKEVQFDRKEMIFRGNVADKSLVAVLKGKCPECNVEHQISDNGYCLKCKVCAAVFPKNQVIPLDERYKHLNNFWLNYNQLINHGTINNIINIYNNSEQDFSCDIKLDSSIFKNKEVTNIINQVLDGHKITMISKLLFTINKDFVYSRNNWYFFTGSIWRCDNDNIEMKKSIIDLSKMFDKIKTHYDNKFTDETTMTLNKNIKSLINKFHKPGYQDDIIKGAKIYNNDEAFVCNLNSKKHLVPFSNGVFDLLENKFRRTKKDDYINLTVNYEYPAAENPEVRTFLEQILPNNGVRDYVLKKMSECLNGDIPNTYFLMFIGDTGANGKSQLLNLMKLAMGDFGEKVEVTLLTRKRNNANEANTEKIKLMHKRFAFLSEPEDGEKINIGLLKELTGSEEIVARGLYQEAMSFVMEAKLFLACNELPEIKGEDTALWRRIRVIDFPSRFVDEPKEPGEYKIDRTLPSRMREDITWRQTFMKIMLEYYYKDVREPIEVQVKTNEYRQENNDFYNWMDENVEQKIEGVLKLKDVCEMYTGKAKIHTSMSTKYRKEIEKYIKEKYKNVVKWEYRESTINGERYRGWSGLQVKDF